MIFNIITGTVKCELKHTGFAHIIDIPLKNPPPLIKNPGVIRGGGILINRGFLTFSLKIPPKNSRLRRDFTTFLNYFVLLFRILFAMFLCTRNACFSSCIQFFRACGALFIFQTFCACVESAIAACKFENCLGSSRFMNNF